ncbi:hypothetical protein GLX30_34285 [Streptomyces sp. Tu 2975]|uniref:hypothetical protein n=1 Tax=Streptomyces sp. Tu 2975 TaxID=2676871 RepID=UPI00135B9DB7|nr:hypothetical protein [Streptomyces sp. Tu 2975]QIP88248.1 hypothetical protein GLX30_34285 [Streptomyces sp. Tu 2975]
MGRMGGWRAALVTAVGVMTAACNAAAYHAVGLTADQLTGRWRSREGTTLAFRENRSFTGEEVARLSAAEPCGDHTRLSSGTWVFGSEEGEAADRGAYLHLTFSGTDCVIPVLLFGEVADPVMCPTGGDPDAGCERDEYLTRVAPLAGSPHRRMS